MDEKVWRLEEILSLNQTEKIINDKATSIGKNFYHYTTESNLRSILRKDAYNKRFFFVRNILGMNDLQEARLHSENGDRIHSFCTCCTKHEKIPLWYLYSGICGRGVRIGFSPGKMLKFIKSIETVYPVSLDGVDYTHPLLRDNDFELQCGWVYYASDTENRVMYRNKWYTVENMNEEHLKGNYFIKSYPWEYEREFRIVLKNKSKEVYDWIAIPIPESVIKSFEIMLAPEYALKENGVHNFVDLKLNPKKIKRSSLNIRMDLLHFNRKEILQEIDTWCEEKDCINICKFVRKKKQCNSKIYGGE